VLHTDQLMRLDMHSQLVLISRVAQTFRLRAGAQPADAPPAGMLSASSHIPSPNEDLGMGRGGDTLLMCDVRFTFHVHHAA